MWKRRTVMHRLFNNRPCSTLNLTRQIFIIFRVRESVEAVTSFVMSSGPFGSSGPRMKEPLLGEGGVRTSPGPRGSRVGRWVFPPNGRSDVGKSLVECEADLSRNGRPPLVGTDRLRETADLQADFFGLWCDANGKTRFPACRCRGDLGAHAPLGHADRGDPSISEHPKVRTCKRFLLRRSAEWGLATDLPETGHAHLSKDGLCPGYVHGRERRNANRFQVHGAWPAPRGVRSAVSTARNVGLPGPTFLTPLLLAKLVSVTTIFNYFCTVYHNVFVRQDLSRSIFG